MNTIGSRFLGRLEQKRTKKSGGYMGLKEFLLHRHTFTQFPRGDI